MIFPVESRLGLFLRDPRAGVLDGGKPVGVQDVGCECQAARPHHQRFPLAFPSHGRESSARGLIHFQGERCSVVQQVGAALLVVLHMGAVYGEADALH